MTFRDHGGEYLVKRLADPETTRRVAEICESTRRIDDADSVYSRARLAWGKDTATVWLESANAFLGGSRPLDVLRTEGAAPVLVALDAEMGGGAA